MVSEATGLGHPATEALEDLLPGKVVRLNTTAHSKERAFARLLDLLSARQMILPDDPALLRELSGLEAQATPNGGLRIAAAGRGHDDLVMALSFTVLALEMDITVGAASPPGRAGDIDTWLRTPNGLLVPPVPSPRWGGLGHDRNYLSLHN